MNTDLNKLENKIRMKIANKADPTEEMKEYIRLAIEDTDDSSASLDDLPKAINYRVAFDKSKEFFEKYKSSKSLEDLTNAAEWNLSAQLILGICMEDELDDYSMYNMHMLIVEELQERMYFDKAVDEYIPSLITSIEETFARCDERKDDIKECRMISVHLNMLYLNLMSILEGERQKNEINR